MEEKQTEKNFDTITAIVLMLVSIGIVVMSLRMTWVAEPIGHPFSSPGVVPLFVGAIIFVLSLILFLQSFKQSNLAVLFSKDYFKKSIVENENLLITTAFAAAYALVFLGRVHYIVATSLFTFCFIVFFEYSKEGSKSVRRKKILIALVIAVISTVSIFFLFEKIFLVHLP